MRDDYPRTGHVLHSLRSWLIALSQARPHLASAPCPKPEFEPRLAHHSSRLGAFRSRSFCAVGHATHNQPAGYWEVIGRNNPRKGDIVVRRAPRRRKTATGMRQDGSNDGQAEVQTRASDREPKLDADEPGTTQ